MELTEQDLIDLGFDKKLMLGTGFTCISSMRPAIYYYIKGRITINATEIWTWFMDDEQRNDIAVSNKESLSILLSKLNKPCQHNMELCYSNIATDVYKCSKCGEIL